MLLHARCGAAGQPAGQRHHRHGHPGREPRLDGPPRRQRRGGGRCRQPSCKAPARTARPNLSHAWARTVDGAQGGTWEACHLLGSAALDAYRGYTGQSRSRQPTHTWNTARIAAVDHGGILADQRDPAEQVADALARQPDPTLAARSDPWILDRQLRERIAEHERVLAMRPPDYRDDLRAAIGELAGGEELTGHHERDRLAYRQTARSHEPVWWLRRQTRDERRSVQGKLAADTEMPPLPATGETRWLAGSSGSATRRTP